MTRYKAVSQKLSFMRTTFRTSTNKNKSKRQNSQFQATTTRLRHNTLHVIIFVILICFPFTSGQQTSGTVEEQQIQALSSLGYRAVAPDLRGYGDTDAPPEVTSYTCLHLVGDLIGLLDVVAPHEEKVFVVGHDWGAVIAWYLCLFRPDRVKALVNMSVQFLPRNPKRKVIDTVKALYGDDYYICRFQEPGEAEAQFAEMGTERVLKELLTYRTPGPLFLPKGKGFNGKLSDTPIVLPYWLSEEDVKYYTSKFEQKGFTGGLNYYRNFDRNWELTAPWTGAQVKVPVKFIVGDQDLTYNSLGAKDYIASGGFKRDVPFLQDLVVMEGVAHFLNQEKADEINKHIYDFIQKF